MIENEKKNNEKQNEKKKKRFFFIFLLIAFLVPIGFGIYALIPERPAPIPTYTVELTNNYNNALTLSNTTACADYNFKTKITLDSQIVPDKILPNNLGEGDVLCEGKPISYKYSLSTNYYVAELTIPKNNIKGNISINVPLATPTDTFKITLKGNGGKFEGNKTEIVLDGYAGCCLNDLKPEYSRPDGFREGYHFDHWELESDRDTKLSETDIIPYVKGGVTYLANCELNNIEVTINPDGGTFPGETTTSITLNTLYDTAINQIDGYPGEPTKEGYKFLYYQSTIGTSINRTYLPTDTVTIEGLKLGIRAVYAENLTITLDAGGGEFPVGAETTFEAYRGITLHQLAAEGYMEPIPPEEDQLFTYWTDENGNEYYCNTVLDISGSLNLTANYGGGGEHVHDVTSYTVIDNHLYGICDGDDACGAQIPVSDNGLDFYENKFLMIENDADSSTDKYVMHDISEMENIIVTAEADSVLEMYFISGEYDLVGSRGAGQQVITVNAHGILKSDGTPSATVDCTHIQPEPYPRFYLYVNFTFDNMIMKGEQGPSDFYTGLFAATITYNNCEFLGMQSLFSDQVIFNDCYFDAITGRTTDPEYSIYSYNSFDVEFNRCTFYSEGKALKIYSEGAGADAVFKIEDCNFTLNDSPRKADKAPIEIDSTYQVGSPYTVYITRCTYDNRYQNGLYHDSSTHSNIILTEI